MERGFVVRGPDPEDRRALRAELTNDGREAAASVRDQEIEFSRTILAKLPGASAATTVASVEDLLLGHPIGNPRLLPGGL